MVQARRTVVAQLPAQDEEGSPVDHQLSGRALLAEVGDERLVCRRGRRGPGEGDQSESEERAGLLAVMAGASVARTVLSPRGQRPHVLTGNARMPVETSVGAPWADRITAIRQTGRGGTQ